MMGTALIVIHYIAATLVVLRVLLRPRMEPTTRLVWILIIEVLPLVGILGYLLFGEIRMRRAEVQRMADVRERLSGLWRPSPFMIETPPDFARQVVDANYATGGFRAVGGNSAILLPEDDSAIDALVTAIDGATEHVHLLFYIWLPDNSGARVAEAAIRAARRGVTVRVIVDALGSRTFVRSFWWGRMLEAGIHGRTAFPWGNPLYSMIFQRLDLRNHRKIAIIDNRVGFTGSRNCSDIAFSAKPRFAPWIDVLFQIEGPVLRQMQAIFLQDWMSYTGEDLGAMLEFVPAGNDQHVIAQVVATGPDRRQGSIADCLCTLIYAAQESCTISTPYYVPDAALDTAIRSAARRGVKVTMILPERNDSFIVSATSVGFCAGLISAGVRIMLFRPGLLHSKIVTVDGHMAMIGSANLDRRSFELNYEMNLLFLDQPLVAKIDARQASYISRARELTSGEIRSAPAWKRIRNNLLALASPLL
ncbi:cardiolipin synthase [Paracoccus pacificus]|uniref:Cardiolipin synthase n=1 Tax=Paracoccus pacificus TaxID=1463598 RepID=A0ABW4R2G1_9RHOB